MDLRRIFATIKYSRKQYLSFDVFFFVVQTIAKNGEGEILCSETSLFNRKYNASHGVVKQQNAQAAGFHSQWPFLLTREELVRVLWPLALFIILHSRQD